MKYLILLLILGFTTTSLSQNSTKNNNNNEVKPRISGGLITGILDKIQGLFGFGRPKPKPKPRPTPKTTPRKRPVTRPPIKTKRTTTTTTTLPLVVKPGMCPTRDHCPAFNSRKNEIPISCSKDGECVGSNKCCYDECLKMKVCKPVD